MIQTVSLESEQILLSMGPTFYVQNCKKKTKNQKTNKKTELSRDSIIDS